MATFKRGKCIIPLLTILLITGCSKQNESIDLNDIDEQVIKEFYENVLDTLLGKNYLYTIPDTDPFLMETGCTVGGLELTDLRFFHQQISKFESLRWEELITREHLLTEEGYDTTIGDNMNYPLYFETYGYYPMSTLTVPLFTSDGKRAFVEHSTYCGPLCGEGCIIEWNMEKGKWVFKTLAAIWIAR